MTCPPEIDPACIFGFCFGSSEEQVNTDGDGFDDGEEVLVMGTDPLDPEPDPVPEPASWLMLVGGIGLLGLLYRRRARGLRLG